MQRLALALGLGRLPAQLPLRHFVAGFLASTAVDLSTFPLDTLKKNLQAYRAGDMKASALEVARRLLREGGPLRFYRGLAPQLVRRGLDGGLLNLVYVKYKGWLEAWLGG